MTLKARITAIDRFIKGCKEDGIYDDLQAACVMAGWDSLAGALTPLKGDAPTNSGFIATDYDRGIGLSGDTSSYIDTNYPCSSLSTNDNHAAVYASVHNTDNTSRQYFGARDTGTGAFFDKFIGIGIGIGGRNFMSGNTLGQPFDSPGIVGMSRQSADEYDAISAGVLVVQERASTFTASQLPRDLFVFARNNTGTADQKGDGTFSFYSIGSATDLALLGARVSTLMADLRAIEEAGFDRDAIAYIRAVEEADGAYLETSVKIAINSLVAGLKADSLWESMASSCLLCGPRTLAGALVPLRGDAPTAYGFVDGDYDRTDGITGDGTSYLDSNRANDADPQDSKHLATYVSSPATGVIYFAGAGSANDTVLRRTSAAMQGRVNRNADAIASAGTQDSTGLIAVARQSDSLTVLRVNGANESNSFAPNTYVSDNIGIFAAISGGSPGTASDATISFYSTGSSLDLAKLDTHISDYVTAIGAAI